MKDLVVTIDGPAGSGKSTTAKLVAQRLGYTYLDTGAMYRAMTLKALESGVDVANREVLSEMARTTDIQVETDPHGTRVILDGRDVTGLLRGREVTANASAVSGVRGVRERMVELQREIGRRGAIVAEGRDIGSVVFPDADVKIYLDADLRCRAGRRKKELEAAGTSVELERIVREIKARDQYDSSREHSPLVVPRGSVLIDTTGLSIDEQVSKVIEEVKKKIDEA